MTPSEIEPATFWLVAQCHNQLRHRVPPYVSHIMKFMYELEIYAERLKYESHESTYCSRAPRFLGRSALFPGTRWPRRCVGSRAGLRFVPDEKLLPRIEAHFLATLAGIGAIPLKSFDWNRIYLLNSSCEEQSKSKLE